MYSFKTNSASTIYFAGVTKHIPAGEVFDASWDSALAVRNWLDERNAEDAWAGHTLVHDDMTIIAVDDEGNQVGGFAEDCQYEADDVYNPVAEHGTFGRGVQ